MTARDKRAAVAGLVVFAVLVFFYLGTLWGFAFPVVSVFVFVWGGVRRV